MNKIAIISAVSLMFSGALMAQSNASNGEDTLKSKIITVLNYKPTISDAKKLAAFPSVIDSTLDKPDATFTFEKRQLNITYKPDSINPARMKGEPLEPLYRNYLRGGVGNGINYLFDGYVNMLRSRDGALGVDIHGKGTQGTIADLPPAPYNRWGTEVYGKKFLKKHEISGAVGYDRERIQYYGYNDRNPTYLNIGESLFTEAYQDIKADAGIKSFYTDSSQINHWVNVHYDYFSTLNSGNSENNIRLDGEASRFFGQHLAQLGILADVNAADYPAAFYSNPYDTLSEKRTNMFFGLSPKFITQAKKWRLEIGLKTILETGEGQTDIRIYPDVYAKYNLVKEIIIPYAGVTGGLQRNSFKTLAEENPFVWLGYIPLQNTNRTIHVFGGFRGAVSDKFTFNLHGGRYLDQQAPLFINYDASQYNPGVSDFGENFFLVVYDTIETIELGGELTYRINERLHVVGKGVYRSYKAKHEFEAWQKPEFEIMASGFYEIRHKLIFKAEAHILGPQWAKTYDPSADKKFGFDTKEGKDVYGNKLKPIIDANIGFEYRYTERLSGFVNLNNLFIQRYQRWNQYPVQRLNVMAGVTYSFWKE